MNKNRFKRNELLAAKVIKGLESRNMEGFYCATKEEALAKALEFIPKGSSIAWGGSESISEIGLKDAVINGDFHVENRDIAKTPDELRAAFIKAFSVDYYLCSSNAITEDGILVNIDGNSNRVACIAYGPLHVIFVVGMNKVMKDIDTAVSRARSEAAPMNAMRFDLKTPCKSAGTCYDCKSPDTICCEFLITRFSRHKGRIKVLLVNDDLGY